MIKNRNFPSNNSYFAEEEIPVCEVTDEAESEKLYDFYLMWEGFQIEVSFPTVHNFLKTLPNKCQNFIIKLNDKDNNKIYCVTIPSPSGEVNFITSCPGIFIYTENNNNGTFSIYEISLLN